MKWSHVIGCASLVVAVGAYVAFASTDEEEAKQIVVMVTGKVGTADLLGAGIVVGAEGDRVYVATAYHVVRPVGDTLATVRVKFRGGSSNDVPATLLERFDAHLDVAVLSVSGLKAQGIDAGALPLDRLGDPSALKTGDPVYLLGNPRDHEWRLSAVPDKFTGSEEGRIRFTNEAIASGYSGGALLNERREVVGMIVSQDPPDAFAAPMPKVLEAIKSWGYPVTLRGRFSAAGKIVLSTGPAHACRVTPGGQAFCWGRNSYGQLGNGSSNDSRTPVPVDARVPFVSVNAGHLYTCGLATSGAVYCWGSANGEWVGACVKAGSPVPEPLPGGLKFRSISTGESYACGVTVDGKAYCWDTSDESMPCTPGAGATKWNAPQALPGDLTFASLSVGLSHACGVTTSGAAYCWGDNKGDQLGDGSGKSSETPVAVAGGIRFKSVSAGAGFTCGVATDGTGYCWGANGRGRLGTGANANSTKPARIAGQHVFSVVSAGYYHACGIATDGVAYCWGDDEDLGALGSEEYAATNEPEKVTGDVRFASVHASHSYNCGIATDGDVYCWGSNGSGQLGTGSSATHSDRPLHVARR